MLNLQIERQDHKTVRLGFLLPGWAWSAVPRLDGPGHETPNLVERPGPSSTTAAIGCCLFFPKDCSEDRVHYLATQFSSDRISAHADYPAVLSASAFY
jgi:hypothetical protein